MTKKRVDPMQEDEALYTVEEVAKRLNVHPDTIRGWIRTRKLQAINLGGPAGYRIKKSALDRFMDERTNTPENE
jgi:excisionase family DNA binding protein